MIVATALPLAARTTSNGGANGGKASKSQSVASANASKPAATAPAAPSVTVPVKQPKGSQLWVKAESRADRYASRDVQVAHQAAPATPRPRAQLSRSIVTPNGCLARVTAYWPSEGDYYTRHSLSSTGVRLHDGHCAVDPSIIPYGSVVDISGVGKFLAVDTGTAVVERTAARQAGHTSAERNAIVVDLFFDNRRDGEAFASSQSKWAAVSWWTPGSTGTQAAQARSLFVEEDWTKIQGKQL